MPRTIQFEVATFNQFIQDIRIPFDALRESRRLGSAMNVWRTAQLNRDELRYSAVLAWLLDCREDHGQGHDILVRLLDRLETKKHRTSLTTRSFPTSGDVQQGRYWTMVENLPMGERDSRVDIQIENDAFLFFIEVKIDAAETNYQLDRYLARGERLAGKRPWGVLYLTTHGFGPLTNDTVKRTATDHANLAFISWKEIATILREHVSGLPQRAFSRHALSQYAELVSNL
ncbi:MAG: PD-(D/E)XK nuclease family protein [Burkholderiales bacterium]